MLDVHPPEHGIHGVRDFMLHLFTITVGLLIAISLEQTVEAMHHRQQRREAEETIRQELEENRAELVAAQPMRDEELNMLVAAVKYVEARAAGKDLPHQPLQLSFGEGAPRDAAWRTASSTGVLAYMDYKKVEAYSDCYKEQDEYARMEQMTLNEYLKIDALIATKKPDDVTKEDFIAGLPLARGALADLMGLKNISAGTMQTYDEALGKASK